MYQKPYLHTLLLFLVSLAILPAQAFYPGTSLPTSPQDCMKGNYYDCDKCACPLSEQYLTVIFILYSISFVFSVVLVIGFFAAKELQELPGDFFLGMGIGQVIITINALVEGIHDRMNNMGTDASNQACWVIAMFSDFGHRVIRSYHVCYLIYYLMNLRYSLRLSKIPQMVYHIMPWFASIALTVQVIVTNGLGKALDGTCGTMSSSDSTAYIVEIVFCAIIFVSSGLLLVKLSKHSRRLDPTSKTHLKYYLIYFVLANLILIGTCVIKFMGSTGMENYLAYGLTNDFSGANEVLFSRQSNMVIDFINCVGVTIIRIADPLLREHWKKLFTKVLCCCFRKREESTKLKSQLLDIEMDSNVGQKTRDVSITANEVVASIQKKSFIVQIQHNYRVQVVYSLLAAMQYYWQVERKPKKPSLREVKDNDYYNRKAKVIEKYTVSDQLMRESAPEIAKEVWAKSFTVVKGTLTVYAPSVFEEIAQIDQVTSYLFNSLGLRGNYNRILKSGIAQGGSSGEFFFFSSDNKFIIKTISKEELNILLALLPKFRGYFALNPKSLIAKIYSAFSFEVEKPYERYHFILMKNVNGFPSNCTDRKYDLKGSTVNRCVLGGQNISFHNLKYCGTLKDRDFDKYEEKLNISYMVQKELMEMLSKDVDFLHSEGLIDYSLAIYLIDKNKLRILLRKKENCLNGDCTESTIEASVNASITSMSVCGDEVHHLEMEPQKVRGGSQSVLNTIESNKEEIMYRLGIIDYLNKYTFKKRAEKFLKQLKALDFRLDVSAQNSEVYSRRFLDYMRRIIEEE